MKTRRHYDNYYNNTTIMAAYYNYNDNREHQHTPPLIMIGFYSRDLRA